MARRSSFAAAQIRTVGFLMAMIPVAVATAILGLVSLVLMTPLMIYAAFRGKHLKNPWRSPRSPLGLIERAPDRGPSQRRSSSEYESWTYLRDQ
ncbi:MAG: hypothetical protein AB1473_18375 [Thermodesulfobacteriota bacterium]